METSNQVMEIKKRVLKRVHALESEFDQNGWRSHYNDLSTFLLNRRGRYLKSKDYTPNDGGKMNGEINNGSPEEAVHTSAAGMMGGFTSPSIPWFHLVPADDGLRDFRPVRDYLWRQQARMYEFFAQSNWYSVLPSVYKELNVFGTAAMRMDGHPTRAFHCTQHTAGSYYLASGPDGFVDTCVYRYPRTVRQLVRLYGEEGVSISTRTRAKNDEWDVWVKCLNVIETNEGRDRKFSDWRGMRYRSITMEEDTEDHEGVLKMGGFNVFPTLTPRTDRHSEDVYGSSRGMRALPDARQIQLTEMRGNEALLKMLRPTLNIPAGMRRATVQAGRNNVYHGQNSDAIRPTFTTAFPYSETRDAIGTLEARVRETLGANVFQQFAVLDATGNHNMTVPEVMERRAEKMVLLGPTQQSVHMELLIPAIELAWFYMGENGDIEEPPPELSEVPLKVEFTSQLALAQRSVVTSGIETYAQQLANLAQFWPEILDRFDPDKAATHLQQGYLTPPEIMREDGAVEEIRGQRAEAQAQAQAAEQQAVDAQTAQQLGNAPIGEGNALEAVLGAEQ